VAADGVAGKWKGSIDTQIGVQNYVYEFKVDGRKLTGTAINNGGKAIAVQNGQVNGDTVTFLEVFEYQGMEIPIEYTGKISGDEIRFTRKVAEFAVEDFVATRVKD
jgi:hypothetical protein